jgi:hypothetical protein
MLSDATAHGLAAVVSFNFNLIELIAIMKLAAYLLGWKQEGTFYQFISAVLYLFLKPIDKLLSALGKQSDRSVAALIVLLLILIPLERVIVFSLTSQ